MDIKENEDSSREYQLIYFNGQHKITPVDSCDIPFVKSTILGEGGYGEARIVYDERDSEYKYPFTQKRIFNTKTNDSEMKNWNQALMFKNNAKKPQSLPYIWRIFRCDEKTPPVYYIIMEYIKGINLQNLIEQNVYNSLTPSIESFLQVAGDLTTALCYLHSRNLVHFDVKPSNIMIKEGFHAVLVDFGAGCFDVDSCSEHMMFTKSYSRATDLNKMLELRRQLRRLKKQNKGDDTELLMQEIFQFGVYYDWYALGLSLFNFLFNDNPKFDDEQKPIAPSSAEILSITESQRNQLMDWFTMLFTHKTDEEVNDKLLDVKRAILMTPQILV